MRDKDQPGVDEQIIRGILQHLIENPDAKDTIEGILKWWLPDGHLWKRGEVQEVLDFMALKGWLTKRKTAPIREVYGINRDRSGEIKKLFSVLNIAREGGEKNEEHHVTFVRCLSDRRPRIGTRE